MISYYPFIIPYQGFFTVFSTFAIWFIPTAFYITEFPFPDYQQY